MGHVSPNPHVGDEEAGFSMTTIRIERVGTTKDQLGEGVLWDPPSGLLYWVDAYGRVFYRLDPESGRHEEFPTSSAIGCVAIRENGSPILALEDGLYFYDPDTRAETPAPTPRIDVPGLRYNDGKVDRQGRLILGTVHRPMPAPEEFSGWICRVDPDFTMTELQGGIGNCNGPAFSPDGRIFYVADSGRYAIYAYDYDIGTGGVSNRRVFVDTQPLGSKPDGATVDADGCLWVAMMDIGRIVRFAPDGRLDGLVEVPVKFPSNVAFGGARLDTLYLTSISVAGRFRDETEHAGGLFAITGLGAQGLPERRFLG